MMTRWFWGMLFGGVVALGGLAVQAASSDWFYGLGAEGSYSYSGQNLTVVDGVERTRYLEGRIHGTLGRDLGRGMGLFTLGDFGVRSGSRFYGDGGIGLRAITRAGTWEGRVYGAMDFEGKRANELYGATGALGWSMGRWHAGLYGYLPLGRSYTTVYKSSGTALFKSDKKVGRGTERRYMYDVALMGGEGTVWYDLPFGHGGDKIKIGLGGYFFSWRYEKALGARKPRVGPTVDLGWLLPVGKRVGVSVYGHYAYDSRWKHQLGLRVGVELHSGRVPGKLLGFRHGLAVASLQRLEAVGPGGGGFQIVRNEKEFREALARGENVYVDGLLSMTGSDSLQIPKGVAICGGMCGTSVLYENGLREETVKLGALEKKEGDFLKLSGNNRLEDLNLYAMDGGWPKALFIDPKVENVGEIKLINVGVHGRVYFYQEAAKAKGIYDIRNLRILLKDTDGKARPFPSDAIPDTDNLDRGKCNDGDAQGPTCYHHYNEHTEHRDPVVAMDPTGALVTVASTGAGSDIQVTTFSASGELGEFNQPLLYLYVKEGTGKFGPVDLSGVHLTKHAPVTDYNLSPLVMVRGARDEAHASASDDPKVRVESISMPVVDELYPAKVSKTGPHGLRETNTSRAALEVNNVAVDAVQWTGDKLRVVAGGYYRWALLYAYRSRLGSLDVKIPEVTFALVKAETAITEPGLMLLFASHLTGDISFKDIDVPCGKPCDPVDDMEIVNLTSDSGSKNAVILDPNVTVRAEKLRIYGYDIAFFAVRTAKLHSPPLDNITGLRHSKEKGYTAQIAFFDNARPPSPSGFSLSRVDVSCVEQSAQSVSDLHICPKAG